MSKIVFKDVHKSFEDGQKVLNGISLEIADGETHIILGQSGCGKSVLLKCLLGIFPIDAGDILVDDLSVKNKRTYSNYIKKFSILFQGNALFDSMTIVENVEFGMKQIRRDSSAVIKSIAQEKLLSVGLESRVFNLYPAEISGGMQKRAALARAIAIEPEVLLFDEPTSGLDPVTGGIICNLLRDTVKKLSITSLTITHDLKVAQFLSDRASILNKGQVVWTGHTDDMKNCSNDFVKEFYHASCVISKKTD
ncbi:MAG: ATP-binding cassette domain-containing protein [Holosporaceae bacterium]|jgi:phospholipid/cholesterol/gamma-HCH transport system ATP-binding protein|nr:ATP-binding cassette domain-containing protein [Holosporaceae bacterium]